MSQTLTDCPLKVKAVLRAVTAKADTFDKSVVMSSLIPSLKYSCSGSPLMFWNGSTQIETPPEATRLLSAAGFPASCMTLASSLRQPGAVRCPSHALSSAHWIWLNGIGGIVPSRLAWTNVSAVRAVSASARTQCDLAASADHSTTTAPAPLIRSSMTSAYGRCAGSSSSRHTSKPALRSSSATSFASGSSLRA